MSTMIPNPPVPNVQPWMWFRVDRDTQIRWVALGHAMSDDPTGASPTAMSRKTPEEIAEATAKVDAYNAQFTRPLFAGDTPHYIGPPVVPPPPPAPAMPPPPTDLPQPPSTALPQPPSTALPQPPRAGEPCPTCGHICPR